MQSKQDLEAFYESPDPWGFRSNPDDLFRKNRIVAVARHYAPLGGHPLALDLGAGEGWITADLPASEIWGFELSDRAAARFPENVRRFDPTSSPVDGAMVFDLVVAAGVLYPQYDSRLFLSLIQRHSRRIVIVCSIKGDEVSLAELGRPIDELEFPYRAFTERLTVYDFST